MPFRVKDVLIVNATIIIGLLILLTFQSISSSFIETESADFMREWHTVQNQYSTTVGLLEDWDCIEDKTFLEGLVIPTPYSFDHVSKEMEDEIKKNCSKWLIQSLEQERHFLSLSEWGYNFHYLQGMDRNGNLYHAATTKEHVHVSYVNTCTVEHPGYNPETELCQSMEPLVKKKFVDIAQSVFFNPEFVVVESTYFKAIVTGPYYVNLANLLMMFPFIASAVIASFNAFRQNEETNKASRTAVVLMGIGFIGVLIGLIFIINAYYEVYGPFLDQLATETWSYDTGTGVNITETVPSPETRSEP